MPYPLPKCQVLISGTGKAKRRCLAALQSASRGSSTTLGRAKRFGVRLDSGAFLRIGVVIFEM
jgi:hypothetical protein